MSAPILIVCAPLTIDRLSVNCCVICGARGLPPESPIPVKPAIEMFGRPPIGSGLYSVGKIVVGSNVVFCPMRRLAWLKYA